MISLWKSPQGTSLVSKVYDFGKVQTAFDPPPSPSFWNSSLNLFCKNSEICIYLREFAMTCFGLKMTNLIFLVTTICPPNHPSPSPFSLLYPSYSSSYHFNISPSPFLLICFVHLDHIYSKTQTFLQTIVV